VWNYLATAAAAWCSGVLVGVGLGKVRGRGCCKASLLGVRTWEMMGVLTVGVFPFVLNIHFDISTRGYSF
jgi:hypothetical protein